MTQAPPRLPACRAVLTAALMACAGWAAAQAPAPAPAPGAMPPSVNSTPITPKAAPPRAAPAPRTEARPTWAELTPAQQQALSPLNASWAKLSEGHKQKWLAVSQNFPAMAPPEQALMHSRMAEWAALSPQQRNQARLNFNETKKVPVDDKKAKWEAYQALPPEEKKKLAAGAPKPVAPPTAAAVKPAPEQKLTSSPKPNKAASGSRIAGSAEINQNTLLPHPGGTPPSPP